MRDHHPDQQLGHTRHGHFLCFGFRVSASFFFSIVIRSRLDVRVWMFLVNVGTGSLLNCHCVGTNRLLSACSPPPSYAAFLPEACSCRHIRSVLSVVDNLPLAARHDFVPAAQACRRRGPASSRAARRRLGGAGAARGGAAHDSRDGQPGRVSRRRLSTDGVCHCAAAQAEDHLQGAPTPRMHCHALLPSPMHQGRPRAHSALAQLSWVLCCGLRSSSSPWTR